MKSISFQRGSTVVGFLMGLIVGLGVAVAVAVFVTKAPIPFVNKATKHSDRVEPKAGAELPDPNKTMQSKAGKPPAASGTESSGEAKPEEKKDSILGLLGTIGGAVGANAGDKSADAPKPDSAKSDAAKPSGSAPIINPSSAITKSPESKPAEVKQDEPKQSGYFLQVGSFQSAQDAENRKARLALAGYEAKVVSAEVDGKTVHRVRTGPYKTFDEMTKARGEITQNGFDVSVSRQ